LPLLASIIQRNYPDNIPFDENEILTLKDYAANLLCFILPRVTEQQFTSTISAHFLRKITEDSPKDDGFSFYGCLTFLKNFGPRFTETCIMYQLSSFVAILQRRAQMYQFVNGR